jgi:hypothetical protein
LSFYTYTYFDEQMVPYYVGEGSRRRYLDKHRVSVPPEARILIQHWESQEKAYEMERWWIALYGRKDIGTGLLLNQTDGGAGVANCPQHKRVIAEYGKRTIKLATAAIDPIKRAQRGREVMTTFNTSMTPEQRFEHQSKAGKVGAQRFTHDQRSRGGKKNAASGHLIRLNHRWHKTPRTGCSLCQ